MDLSGDHMTDSYPMVKMSHKITNDGGSGSSGNTRTGETLGEVQREPKNTPDDRQRSYNEIQGLRKQYATLKKQYDHDVALYNKVQVLIQKQQLVKAADVKKMQQEISRQLRSLGDTTMMEEPLHTKFFRHDSPNEETMSSPMSAEWKENISKSPNDDDLQKLELESGSNYNDIEDFRSLMLQRLHALRENALALQKKYEASQEIQGMQQKKVKQRLEELNEELKSSDARVTVMYEKHQKLSKKAKEREKELKSLKMHANQEKSQLASQQQIMDRLKHDFESKCNTAELQINTVQTKVEELRQAVQKQESGMKDLKVRQSKIEHEKIEYLHNKKNEVEKNVNKEQKTMVELQKLLLQIEREMKELKPQTKGKKEIRVKLRQELQEEKKKCEEALETKQRLEQQLQEHHKAHKEAVLALEKNRAQYQQMRETEDKLQEINQKLHKTLQEKTEKEKRNTDREKKLAAKENRLKEAEEKQKLSLNQTPMNDLAAFDSHSHYENTITTTTTSSILTRHFHEKFLQSTLDPLFQYRALFPFPWLAVILFISLLISILQMK